MVVENLEFHVKRTGDAAASGINNISASLQKYQKQSQKATGFTQKLASSLARIAFYRVIRSVIKGIGEALKEGSENAYWFSKAINGDLAKALDELATKNFTLTNQFGAAWATLLQTIQPILLQIISIITKAMDLVTQFFAALGGKGTYLKAIDYSKQWAEQTKSGSKAAKEWKNQLLGFDEINKLEAPSNGGGGGGKALDDYSKMFEETEIGRIAKLIKDNLNDLELFASGMALGIGLVLTFTGANVPLGLGLIALGATGMAHALHERWGEISSNIYSEMGAIMMIAAGLMFGIGLILTLSGASIPLGLGLMAAGAATFAAAAVVNWNGLPEKVKSVLKTIGVFVTGSLMILGVLFLVSGNIPLGLGLLLAGGVTGLATYAAFDPEGFVDKILSPLRQVKQGFDEFIAKVQEAFAWLESFFGVNTRVAQMEADGSIYLQGFAAGGYPDEGQLFMAREAGPELVGTVGGRTAVATNNDIVAAVSAGVAEAVSGVMGSGSAQPVSVRVFLDSREIKSGQQRLARATGGA